MLRWTGREDASGGNGRARVCGTSVRRACGERARWVHGGAAPVMTLLRFVAESSMCGWMCVLAWMARWLSGPVCDRAPPEHYRSVDATCVFGGGAWADRLFIRFKIGAHATWLLAPAAAPPPQKALMSSHMRGYTLTPFPSRPMASTQGLAMAEASAGRVSVKVIVTLNRCTQLATVTTATGGMLGVDVRCRVAIVVMLKADAVAPCASRHST
jgi:hypothetical protein